MHKAIFIKSSSHFKSFTASWFLKLFHSYFRFSPSYGSSLPKAWDYSSWRKPALTGILIHWPDREVDHTTLTDDTLSFKLTVKWVSGATSDESVVHKFETFLNDCQAEEEIEIAVESPVELINGYNYSIIVEVMFLSYAQDVKLSAVWS